MKQVELKELQANDFSHTHRRGSSLSAWAFCFDPLSEAETT